ncbi:arylamine N-acetyltransferase [Saccharopolyspora erythraea]|uniref:arylamine N-acetyltransferase family protein n=1 Tax=Saccharopolyspora erythraea TaxID=1836 RepID=UPI001BA644BA|nr:arylamine N-acetyltransferase [Saccharopolyspora erythraea]QUG99444.1 arylamine N-acetyltransferase [Saccharopolyspora erythraea]
MDTSKHREGRGWEGERLDLDAYLARIGYRGDRSPTIETLRALHFAHVTSIPFENLEIVLGRGLPLDLDPLQDKLVRRARGGYCFEHARLFSAVAERLGFGVTGLLSRVSLGSGKLRPATHAVPLVTTADTDARWLCDVGFGSSPLQPIEFADGTVMSHGGWTHRLARDGGTGEWEVQRPAGDGWEDMHHFPLNPAYAIDYVVGNHYVSTHPNSPFVGRVALQRMEPGVLHVLDEMVLTTHRPDGSVEKQTLEAGEVPKAVSEVFGIELDAEDDTALLAHLRRDTA